MFCVPVDVPSLRETEAGSEAGSIEQGCLLARFRLMFSGLSYTAQAYLPKDDTTLSGLGSPKSINNHEIAPTDMPTCQSDGGTSSTEIPSSQCVKLRIN